MPNARDKTILFEVPDLALSLQLCERLQDEWGARVVGRSESRFVSVPLDREDARMELLLWTVAEWAAEVGLSEVLYRSGGWISLVVASSDDV